MKTGTLLAIAAAVIGGALLISKGGDGDEAGDGDGDGYDPDDYDEGEPPPVGEGYGDEDDGADPGNGPGNSVGLDRRDPGLTFDNSGMVYDVHGQPVAASVSGKKVLYPKVFKLESLQLLTSLGDYICANDQPLQKQSIDLSMGDDLNAAWQPFYGWCVAFIAQGNDYGVTPGFYATLQQHNKDRKYVFGPFTNIKEVPGGRPEVNVEDTLRALLYRGTAYAKAREVK